MRYQALTFLFILISVAGFSQKSEVTGALIDDETGDKLPFANVTAHNVQDSALVSGASADGNGNFKMELPYGEYIFKYSFIGYATSWSQPKVIDREQVQLPPHRLKTDAAQLQEAVIEGERSEMTMDLEKKVFNVADDITSRGGSVADVLENVPSVDVDQDGTVSLRGNSNVRILINGKQSGLVGVSSNEALQLLNSEMVERIEIINNPSARYDAEGMAGIINIVLKKEKREGTNAVISAGARYPRGYNTSLNLTHKVGDWTFSGNYGFRDRTRPGYSYQERLSRSNGMAETLYQDELRTRSRTGHNIMGGVGWEPNQYNEIEFTGVFSISDGRSVAGIDYLTENSRGVTGSSRRDFVELEDKESYNFTLEHTKTFDEEDRRWRSSMDYNNSFEIEDAEAEQYFYDEAGDELFEQRLLQQTLNNEQQINWVLESDYEHPFSENGKLEGGIKSSLRIIDTKYSVENFDPDEEVYREVPEVTNDFLYDEGIHAAYFMYNNEWGKFSLMAGIRAEWSVIRIEQALAEEDIDRNYVDPFPSFAFSYKLNDANAFQMNYSRRIRRPHFWNLNPFFNYRNPVDYRSGNPELNPQYTDAYELSHILYSDKGSINTSVYYRYSTGVIQYVQRVQDGITITRPENVAEQHNYGLEVAGNYRPMKGWRVNGSFNYYGSRLDATNIENGFRADFSTWQVQANSTMELFWGMEWQLRVNHRAATVRAQGVRNPITFVTSGIGKSFFDDKLTVDFSVRDIFNSRIRRGRTIARDFVIYNERQWRPRTYQINLTYRIQNQKSVKDKEKKIREELDYDD